MKIDEISCNDTECVNLLKCYQKKLKPFNRANIPNYDQVLKCIYEKIEVNQDAQYLFTKIVQWDYVDLISQGRKGCEIGTIWYGPYPSAFAKLRGKEAFEAALLYASETECVDTDDVVGGGNLGTNVIEYIINPMIKSVGGYPEMVDYINSKGYNDSDIKVVNTDNCKAFHEKVYKTYLKAYKEGKIVLKKYGEE